MKLPHNPSSSTAPVTSRSGFYTAHAPVSSSPKNPAPSDRNDAESESDEDTFAASPAAPCDSRPLALRTPAKPLGSPEPPAAPRVDLRFSTPVTPATEAASTIRTLAKPIQRMPLSEKVAGHPAYIGLWEAIRLNDGAACKKHLDVLEDLDGAVLHHTLTAEVLELGAFSQANAPEGSAAGNEAELPPAACCDAYALIVDRARPQTLEEACGKMGPGRPAAIAAALGHAQVLKALIEQDVNVCNLSEVVVLDGNVVHTSPAFWAAYFGHADCLRLLQQYGMSVNSVREALMHKARPATVQWLCAGNNDRQKKSAVQAAMVAAIDRSTVAALRDAALADMRALIANGKLALNHACDAAPNGWLYAAIGPDKTDNEKPAHEAAVLLLQSGAPPWPLGATSCDLLQLSLRSGNQALIAAFLEVNAALRKRRLPTSPPPLPVTQTHFLAAIDGEEPQPTFAQLLSSGYGPVTPNDALQLFRAAYSVRHTRIAEILQIQYRLLKDKEGRSFARLSTHKPMTAQSRELYRQRCDKLLAQCRRDEVAVPFDQRFSGDADRDLHANLDTAPVHNWWGMRPVYNGAKTVGIAAADRAASAAAWCLSPHF